MKAKDLKDAIVFCIENRWSLLITGAPGIGKTDVVEQAFAEYKAKHNIDAARLIVSLASLADPTDFKGYPTKVNESEAAFIPFAELKLLIDATAPLVCFFDDIGQAAPATQAALMHLLLARQINGKKISDHVTFIAATNRKQDRAAVSGILEPVKSRFVSIVEMTVSADDWFEWAATIGNMPTDLISFNQWRPELMSSFKATSDMTNSPCPRTIAAVGRMINAGLPEHLRYEMFKGAVGEAYATEFMSFLSFYKDLPDIEEVVNTPKTAHLPKEIGVLYALSGVLVDKLSVTNADNLFIYLNRLPIEIATATIKSAVTKNKSLAATAAFVKWATDNSFILLN